MTATTPDAHPRDDDRRIPLLLALLVLCVGGGALIGVLSASSTSQYGQLDLPSFAPPSSWFGPVWTVLYTLMAVSAWLVARTDHPFRARALTAFAVQLVVNFAWTPVFFGLQARAAALGVIVAVLVSAGWWAVEAGRVHRTAGFLQLPYLAWTSFATVLNAAIVLA
ncbi:TspO/MBR family protein [Euzebya sp.]|uniref:TspO/MBR family protein n=1 Tax=Euzebya sp. TaxID=1971409 RepID=UPI003514D29F